MNSSPFPGIAEENHVKLSWQTATEINNYGFEVERSLTPALSEGEGVSMWKQIGFVLGTGNSSTVINYSFVDNEYDKFGKYSYRLKQIDFDGSFKYSNEVEVEFFPKKFSLEQNYPNPFNPSTKIKYTIPNSVHPLSGGARSGLVTLKVYDILGNEIATLVNEEQPAGSYEVEFNIIVTGHTSSGTVALPSGVYFYQLTAGSSVQTKKMILVR